MFWIGFAMGIVVTLVVATLLLVFALKDYDAFPV